MPPPGGIRVPGGGLGPMPRSMITVAAAAALGIHAIHFQTQRQAEDAIRRALSTPQDTLTA